MSACNWPITTTAADDAIRVGSLLWRQRKQLFATVAVKATFTLVPGAKMTLREPLPIECTERQVAPTEGIEPGDLAPCLAQPEIWVRGHAWHPPAEGAPSVRVRLIVARDGSALVRKSVEIPIQRDPFVAPFLHALAPLSRKWPVRTRLLGAFDWTALDRSPIELPDVFDWTYFQAAPTDQHLGPLRGDEWIRLEAIHSTMHRFDTQLPSASCAIMMFGQVDPFRAGAPLRVGLDTVQLDVDHGTCSLVFRGHTPLPSSVAIEDLQFVAGLGLPDRPLPKLEPRTANSRSAPVLTLDAVSADQTLFVDASSILHDILAQQALPFHGDDSSLATPVPPTHPPQGHADAGQTFMLDERMLRTLNEQEALPFHESSSESRSHAPNFLHSDEPPAPPPAMDVPATPVVAPARLSSPTPAAAPVLDVGSTFMLSEELLEQLASNPATPFAGGEPAPERDEPADVLAGLPFQPAAEDGPPPGRLGAIFLAAMEESMRANGPVSLTN